MAGREELVARARELAPRLGEMAETTERNRSLPEETISAFKDAGLLRALVPGAWGGYELDFGVVVETTRELGRYCGSSAWCLAICTLHNRIVSTLPDQACEEVFGASPDAVVCGVFMPGGKAFPVDGGYRLSGQWDFASTCDHAGHALLAGLITGGPDGDVTGLATFLVRRQDFSIEDNWHVAGLQGTGSKRVAVQDVFVPTGWTKIVAQGDAARDAGGARGSDRERRTPHLPVNSTATLGLTGVPLGIALGALSTFEERLAGKVRVGTAKDAEAQVGAQLRLAESAVEVDCAELLALRDCEEMMRTWKSGQWASVEQRGRYRRDTAYIFQTCARAVARLMPAAGAHGIYLHGSLQRAMRDTQIMATHIVADWDQSRETYARALLDLPVVDAVY